MIKVGNAYILWITKYTQIVCICIVWQGMEGKVCFDDRVFDDILTTELEEWVPHKCCVIFVIKSLINYELNYKLSPSRASLWISDHKIVPLFRGITQCILNIMRTKMFGKSYVFYDLITRTTTRDMNYEILLWLIIIKL